VLFLGNCHLKITIDKTANVFTTTFVRIPFFFILRLQAAGSKEKLGAERRNPTILRKSKTSGSDI
jgi:hypothetical protein